VLAAEWPAVNAVASALALARTYDLLAAGGLIGQKLLDEATRPQSAGRGDLVLERDSSFGLGFMLPADALPIQTEGAYGHPGAGGGFGGSVRQRRFGFGFVPGRLPSGNAMRTAADLFDLAVAGSEEHLAK